MNAATLQTLIARDFRQQAKFESSGVQSVDSSSGLITSQVADREYPREEIGTASSGRDIYQGMSTLNLGSESAKEMPIIFGRNPFTCG